MSEDAAAPVEAEQPADGVEVEVEATEADWKARSRHWEKLAKANSDAAKRLAELEDAQKSAEQKAAEREAAAVERATAAELRALRREVALDSSLSKDDAALLDDLTDEDAMRRLASRLATADADKRKTNHVSREGGNPRPGPDAERDFVRELFRSA